MLSLKQSGTCRVNPTVQCIMNMVNGQSDEPGKLQFGYIMDELRKLWDNAPQPVKSFPWKKASGNFIQLILDLVLAVIKYLSLPVFTITSISEMSYCAHEKKLSLVPLPFLVGVAVAGVLREAAIASSPSLKVNFVCCITFNILIEGSRIKVPIDGINILSSLKDNHIDLLSISRENELTGPYITKFSLILN